MTVMEKGGKKTPHRVVEYIKGEVSKIGQNATARAIGLPLFSVQKYMAGNSEPTQASLEKIADHFNVSVPHLREETFYMGGKRREKSAKGRGRKSPTKVRTSDPL